MRSFATIAVLAVSTALLGGCGGGGAEKSIKHTSPGTVAGTTLPAPSGSAPSPAGAALFRSHCSSCHTLAEAKATGTVGPNLDNLTLGEERVKDQVEHGGKRMPPFEGVLSKKQISLVSQYVIAAEQRS